MRVVTQLRFPLRTLAIGGKHSSQTPGRGWTSCAVWLTPDSGSLNRTGRVAERQHNPQFGGNPATAKGTPSHLRYSPFGVGGLVRSHLVGTAVGHKRLVAIALVKAYRRAELPGRMTERRPSSPVA